MISDRLGLGSDFFLLLCRHVRQANFLFTSNAVLRNIRTTDRLHLFTTAGQELILVKAKEGRAHIYVQTACLGLSKPGMRTLGIERKGVLSNGALRNAGREPS